MFVRDGKFVQALSLRGGLAIATPGEVKGLTRVLRDFGTLPLAAVLAPAIGYAERGFPVGPHLAAELAARAGDIRKNAALAAVYLKPDGTPYAQDETLVQKDLAATLRDIAAGGPQAFYEGAIADRIARAVREAGGILDAQDLRGYRERTRTPLRTPYHGLTIVGVPPPSSGGGVVLEILNVLEGYDLRSEGGKSAFALHRLAQAEAVAFRDRGQYYGDPDFVDVPMDRLLSTAHAEELRRELAGGAKPSPTNTVMERGGTAHTSTLDAAGNAVAITTTINTAFGAMVMAPGTGIVLNNEMDDFSAAPGVPNIYGLLGNEANAIAGGKRPLSSMSPTIVLRDRAPLLTLGGSGGGRIITATTQTLVNVLDFGMDLEAAVAAPRIHEQGVPPPLYYEPTLEPAIQAGLRKLGDELVEASELGAVGAVMAASGGLVGTGDPRKHGAAAGW